MEHFSKNRVILIENDRGGWYEKAIFILSKDISNKQRPRDIISEAEKIIGDYMKKNKSSITGATIKLNPSPKVYKKNHVNWILNCCLILSIILFMYCAAQIYL